MLVVSLISVTAKPEVHGEEESPSERVYGIFGADGQVRSGVRLVIPPLREQPSAPQQVVDAVRRVTQTPDAADPPAPRDDATQHYRVRPGDTLSLIADVELGSRDRWREIYELNRDRIENPDMLVEGDRLRLPR